MTPHHVLATIFLVIFTVALTPTVCQDGGSHFAQDSQTEFIAMEGQNITLPCRIHNLQVIPSVPTVVWLYKEQALFLGEFRITTPDHIDLTVDTTVEPKEYNLHITGVSRRDIGQYKCRINQKPKQDLIIELDLMLPASIELVSPSKVSVREGESTVLECSADGNPWPDVTWKRLDNLLPSGEGEHLGSKLVLDDVTRDDSGTYQCAADNHMNNPQSETLTLTVEFPPEVITPLTTIHTAEGEEVTIKCEFQGELLVLVNWYKSGHTLLRQHAGGNVEISQVKDGYRVTTELKLLRVSPDDMVEYSCVGENQLGQAKADIKLTGKPHEVKILSQPKAYRFDQYNLEWSVISKSPLLGYEILVHYKNGSEAAGGEWSHPIVVTPTAYRSTGGGAATYREEYLLSGLTPETEYSVHVEARNRYGRSRSEETLRFTTLKQGVIRVEGDEQDSGATTSSIHLIHLLLSSTWCLLLLLPQRLL